MQNHMRNKIAASKRFLGGMTAKLWPNLRQGVPGCNKKHRRKM